MIPVLPEAKGQEPTPVPLPERIPAHPRGTPWALRKVMTRDHLPGWTPDLPG